MASQLQNIGKKAKAFVGKDHQILIDGEWRAGSGEAADIIDPSTGETIGRFAGGDAADVDAAVKAARRAFDQTDWPHLPPAARAKLLWRIADLIEANTDELAELESIDGGKLIGPARGGEIPAAAETFRYHAGWCTKIEGRTFTPSIPGLDLVGSTRLEPIGVAGLITPWNGPLVMAAWKLAPALAAGCATILKPAENTVLSTLRLGELLRDAGVPAGVVNIVTGGGASVGSLIAADMRVDKISFTGSTATARSLVDDAKSNLKKLSLELGGKSPTIVFDDANIEAAIAGASEGVFSNAGQVCVAGSRILVQRKAYQQVVDGVAAYARGLRLGPSLDPNTTMGPLISAAQQRSVAGMVGAAAQEGVDVVCGGVEINGPGFFYAPTVLTNAGPDSAIWRDEVFGPVVVIAPFETEEEALLLANDSRYGLAASVWTNDASRSERMTRALRAGIVWVNCHGIPDMAMPIGGYKQSGWGREHGWRGIEAYLEHKSIMKRVL